MSALRIKNCRLREKSMLKEETFTAGNDDWAFHAHARGIHRPASGTRCDLRRGCADGAALPAQPTVQQGFACHGSLKKAGLGYVHLPGLGGLRHAKRDSLNAGLAKCLLSRLCGLHADAGI